ncbi:hypothetical protein C0991_003340 [Blastosporella zonata]|nr:hypothetical protein C0991_003340 [Blastosporella zonata]
MSTNAAVPARTSFVSHPNVQNPSSNSSSSSAMPPELEAQLAMLSSHRSVLGYMLVSRGHPVSIIRHSGVIFEGEQGRKYATVIGRIVESVQGGLEEVHAGETDGDEVRFMRIRTKRHELMISPGSYNPTLDDSL